MAIFYFARCELDTDRRDLKVADIARDLEPKVFDLLSLLVRREKTVVSREELIEHVWKGRVVSDSAISVCINAVRRAVGDSGKDQAIIKTVPRRGFKLVVAVTKKESANLSPKQKSDKGRSGLSIELDATKKPVLAVFPFELIGATNNQSYLSRGIADDIATELSRFHTIAVISTFSSFQHKSTSTNDNSFAKSLGASHTVSGTFQKQGTRLRMTVSLGEENTKTIVWSEKYECDENEILDTRDEAVSQIVGNLFSQLREHQTAMVRKKPVANPSAYECLLRATDIYKAGDVTLEDSEKALYWFNRTLELDPYSARAMAWRECCSFDFHPNPPSAKHHESAMQNMKLALSIDPNDHEVHRIIGALHLIYCNRDLADYHLAKSAELNPNDARILLRIGYYRSFLGDRSNAMNYIDRAFERNPLHPDFYWQNRGVVLFGNGEYDEALKCLQLSDDQIEQTRIYETACYAALGNLAMAKSSANNLLEQNPGVDLSWLKTAMPYRCYQDSAMLKHLTDLLGEAGIPAHKKA